MRKSLLKYIFYRQKAKGKRQKAKGKRQKAKGVDASAATSTVAAEFRETGWWC
jgi:hypothetical protein